MRAIIHLIISAIDSLKPGFFSSPTIFTDITGICGILSSVSAFLKRGI